MAISSAGCLTPLVASEISPWCDIMARAICEKPFVVDVRASPGATEKNPTLAIQAADMAGGRLLTWELKERNLWDVAAAC